MTDAQKIVAALLDEAGPDLWHCQECGEDFPTEKAWLAHEEWHQGQERGCPECGLMFTAPEALEKHKAWHAANPPMSKTQRKAWSSKFHPATLKTRWETPFKWPKMREYLVGRVTGAESPGKPVEPSLQIKGAQSFRPPRKTPQKPAAVQRPLRFPKS